MQKKYSGPFVKIALGRKTIYVLGTAHVSAESVKDVGKAIAHIKPDVVGVELCESRHEALMDKERIASLDLVKIIKERRLALLASSLILSAFQKKIGLEAGVKPGAEMEEAIRQAEKRKKKIVLADRNIRITLRRAWHGVGFFSRLYLISYLISALLFREDLKEEDIERLKSSDILDDLLDQLPEKYSVLRRVILEERDAYLAAKMLKALESEKGTTFLLVVGAAHVSGIVELMKKRQTTDISRLEAVPPASHFKNILSLVFLMATSGLLAVVFKKQGVESLRDLAGLWVLGRSIGAGLGAILARAHIGTVLVTIVMAPFAFFIAIFGPRLWMFSAITEVSLRRPRFEDFENLAEDTHDVGALWHALGRNRVLRLLAVTLLVSLGLTFGNLPFWGKLFFSLF